MTHQTRSSFFLPVLSAALIILFACTTIGCKQNVAGGAPVTFPTPELPDTPAGRQLSTYLSVFNGPSADSLKAFIAEHFTPVGPGGADLASRTRTQVRLRQSSHGLDVYEVVESRDHATTVIARFRLTQEWRKITLMVEDAPPYRISGMMIVPIDPPVLADTAPLSDDEMRQQINDYINNLVAADQFSGTVLVARGDALLFEKAYGTANRERSFANQLSTRFSFASVGKMFTAVAVAQLVESGKLGYDDPISRHLPAYPAAVARRVTIDHLLTHRSGIVDFFADEMRFQSVMDSPDPQRDYLRLFMQEPLRFEPGERFEYSNSNYIILGAIVERVSGMPFAEYLLLNVFEPAGMTETSLSAEGIDEGLLAKGYTEFGDDGQIHPGSRHLFVRMQPRTGSAAGGGYTTAGDLLRFDRALRTNVLLRAPATEQVLTARVDDQRPGYKYGYGFSFRMAGEEIVAGHSGGFPGVAAVFEMYLGSGYTVVVLANYELVAEPVVTHIQEILRRSSSSWLQTYGILAEHQGGLRVLSVDGDEVPVQLWIWRYWPDIVHPYLPYAANQGKVVFRAILTPMGQNPRGDLDPYSLWMVDSTGTLTPLAIGRRRMPGVPERFEYVRDMISPGVINPDWQVAYAASGRVNLTGERIDVLHRFDASFGHEVLLASPTSLEDPNYRFNIAAVTINGRGDVAVLGTLPPDAGSTARRIYVVSGPGAVRRVARIGDTAPGAGGATFSGVISVNGFNNHFGEDLREFILPYDAVRQADDPDAVLLDFLESTYVAAAERGGWDRERLEFNAPRRAWKTTNI